MQETEIYSRLTSIFHSVFNDDTIILAPDMAAADIEDWDSLHHFRLIFMVEKEFGTEFATPEIEKLVNVGEFVALIRSKI